MHRWQFPPFLLSSTSVLHGMDQLAVVERVIRDFPCLTPLSNDLSTLVGYVKLSSRSYRLSLRTDCTVLRGDTSLHALLSENASTAARRLSLAPDAHALLLELRALVERASTASSGNNKNTTDTDGAVQLAPRGFYDRLLREVGRIGWNRVNLHESLRSLEVSCEDAAKRRHNLSIYLPLDYPTSPATVHALLPESFEPFATDEAPSSVSLLVVVERFEQRLRDFELLWNVLDDIDANCQVVEPENPTRAETYRRVIVDVMSSLRIEFDARSPVSAFPTVRFLGSAAAVVPLRARLNEHVHLWDSSGNTLPRENLSTVLDLTFPAPKKAAENAEDNTEDECGICYAYRHEGKVPDVACDRLECAKSYHRACLVEWLRALPDTRQSFDTLMGACVYCEQPISVNVVES